MKGRKKFDLPLILWISESSLGVMRARIVNHVARWLRFALSVIRKNLGTAFQFREACEFLV